VNYTVGHKKRDMLIFVITLANIDRFSFFTAMYNNELRNKNLLKFSPHLNREERRERRHNQSFFDVFT